MQTIEQANAETNRLRLLKIERIKRLQMEQYRKDPLLWLEERFGEDRKSFVWSDYEGYENHEWDGDKNPLAQAWQDVANKKWVGVESATGTGKTYWLARLVFWFLDVYKDALVVTSAPKQDQLKLNLWAEIGKEFHKFKHLHPNAYMNFLNIRVDGLQERVADEKSLENSWQAVGFVAGTGADEESATKARGFHRKDMLIIIEESSGMNNAVVTAFKNTSTGGNNVIVAVGNPNSEIDPLHQFCTSGIANAYRISALDFPNVVLNKEIVAGAVTTGSIELRKKDYGEDSPLYAAMVRGISPAQSAHSLIKYAWIEQCIDFDVEPDGSYNAVGVDVANSLTGDKAALAWGKENTLLELQEFRCENASHLAYNIVMDDMRMDDLYESLVMQRVKSMGVQSADDLTTLPDSISRYGTSTIDDYGVEPEFIGVDSVGVGASTLQQFHNLGYYATALQGGSMGGSIDTR
jgi:hypothetical protein